MDYGSMKKGNGIEDALISTASFKLTFLGWQQNSQLVDWAFWNDETKWKKVWKEWLIDTVTKTFS